MIIRSGLLASLVCVLAGPAFAQVPPKTPDAKPPATSTPAKPDQVVLPDGRVVTVFTPKKLTTPAVTPNAVTPNATTNVTPPTPATPTIPTVPKQGVVRPNCAS